MTSICPRCGHSRAASNWVHDDAASYCHQKSEFEVPSTEEIRQLIRAELRTHDKELLNLLRAT
jgi:hypothetical protein